METVFGITTGMLLILDVGTLLTVTNIESNIAMVASKLVVRWRWQIVLHCS